MKDPQNWEFFVVTALHDDLKFGLADCPKKKARVVMSREAYPDWRVASEVAGCVAVATNGGMPIKIQPVY